MSSSLKGGLFVGGAVAVGLLVGFLLPPLVVGRQPAEPKTGKAPLPAMPDVIGRPLDEAELQLNRREIAYVTDRAEIFGVVVPSIWEVCETDPGAGKKIRGTAYLRAALPGTCGI